MIGLAAAIIAQAAPAVPQQVKAPVPQSAAPASAPPAPSTADDLLTAEVLITQNRFDEARKLLSALDRKASGVRARDNQVQFLLGLLDMNDKDYDSAISRFRRVLVSEPGAVRVRLEMGRAYYLAGRYSDAERQFMYARAGNVPRNVRANIDRYLAAVRQRKTFSFGFSMSLAPDSNLNAGPATDAVTLYGLPFQLSPNARANSGVGLLVDTSLEWAPRISTKAKWRIGALAHRSQYRQTEFDDMTLAFYTGPHVSLKRWDLNLLGNVARRWYGDRGYTRAYGPSADVTYYVSSHLGIGLSGAVSQIDYDQIALQSGLGESLTLSSFYTPTTSSYIRGAVTLGRQNAGIAAYAYGSRQFGLAYTNEFRGGITASIAPTYTTLDYDAALAAFATIRRDRQYTVQVSLLDRRIDFHGLTPRLAYTFIKNDSNIALYSFKRSRFEIGITSSF